MKLPTRIGTPAEVSAGHAAHTYEPGGVERSRGGEASHADVADGDDLITETQAGREHKKCKRLSVLLCDAIRPLVRTKLNQKCADDLTR